MAAPEPATRPAARSDTASLAVLTSVASIAAFLFYYHRDAILLYGDAVAHLNIARRVIDSRTPGLFQLGTVWLPLPHVLQIPFVWNDWLWRTGIGAAIPSMLSYIAGAIGIFRLVREQASQSAAWIAALTFALNPNLLYLQATAMTESLYLACFIWVVVYFAEFVQQIRKSEKQHVLRPLQKCSLVLAAAMFVRYDAWFLAAAIAVGVLIALWRQRPVPATVYRNAVNCLLLTALIPGLWLAYNHAAYGNPLEFANGPYSARAIQQRTRTATMPTYPGENSPRTAALYVIKVSRLNLAEGPTEYPLFVTAFVAWLAMVFFARRHLPLILLWIPLPFYVICVAWGSLPIYLPEWWPFSYYNVRYGLQLLPAVAVFLGLGYEFVKKFFPAPAVALAAGLMVVSSYAFVWSKVPICLREALANGSARMAFDRQLSFELSKLPPSSTLMMDCSAHPGAVQMAGIPFRRVLRESNPVLWEMALTQPARSADYVIAISGDDVSRSVRLFPQHLTRVATIGTQPGPQAVIYRSTP